MTCISDFIYSYKSLIISFLKTKGTNKIYEAVPISINIDKLSRGVFWLIYNCREGSCSGRGGWRQQESYRASSSYFFLFFPIFLGILLFFLFFSNFLLFFLFFSHFTYNKQIFVGDLNILSLFKYVVYRVH